MNVSALRARYFLYAQGLKYLESPSDIKCTHEGSRSPEVVPKWVCRTKSPPEAEILLLNKSAIYAPLMKIVKFVYMSLY